MDRLAADGRYCDRQLEVPYGGGQRCDLCIGRLAKGNPDHQNIGHILSPYPNAGSALVDCEKHARFAPADRKAILIIGYDHDSLPRRRRSEPPGTPRPG
jgi:hypothetical protein